MDDGGDLVNTLHEDRPELIVGVRGGCEATSTGAARLRLMAAAGSLGFPGVAADASSPRPLIHHKYSTGQSALGRDLRATNTPVAGKRNARPRARPRGAGIS